MHFDGECTAESQNRHKCVLFRDLALKYASYGRYTNCMCICIQFATMKCVHLNNHAFCECHKFSILTKAFYDKICNNWPTKSRTSVRIYFHFSAFTAYTYVRCDDKSKCIHIDINVGWLVLIHFDSLVCVLTRLEMHIHIVSHCWAWVRFEL